MPTRPGYGGRGKRRLLAGFKILNLDTEKGMSSRRADQPRTAEAVEGGSKPGSDPSLLALEEKARRLLKRCRYDDAARSFKQVVVAVEAEATSSAMTRGCSRTMLSREIAALEGLAICLSRQLE